MSKTVLLCSNAYPPRFIGGAELVAHYQAKALQKSGCDVVVYTGDTGETGARHELRYEPYDGVPVYRTRLVGEDYRHDRVNFHHAAIEEQFVALLDRFRPDIVHLHNLIGLSAGLPRIAKRSGARVVVTLHDYWGFCFKNTLIKHGNEICSDFERCEECLEGIDDGDSRGIPVRMRNDYIALQLGDVDALVSPSLYLAQQYAAAGFPVGRLWTIWNGIDVERFASVCRTADPHRVRFTFIGHFGPHKGVQTIVEALPLIGRPPDSYHVTMVGVGELMEPLRRRVSELGLSSSVTFLGRVPNENIVGVFANTDVQLLPSVWPENQPVSITEAMAAGSAVIASRLGGSAELVEDGKSGLLCEPANPHDLADKMRAFIDCRERISEFGRCGLARISSCTFDAQVKKLLQIYESPAPQAANGNIVVVCSGRRFPAALARMIDAFPRRTADGRFFFVMDEWISSDDLRSSSAVIVCDSEPRSATVAAGRSAGLPVFVPASAVSVMPDSAAVAYRTAEDLALGLYDLLACGAAAR